MIIIYCALVFFYDESKTSSKALEHMEDIDDETDVFQIRLKIRFKIEVLQLLIGSWELMTLNWPMIILFQEFLVLFSSEEKFQLCMPETWMMKMRCWSG